MLADFPEVSLAVEDAVPTYLYLNTHTKSYEEHSEVIHEGNPTTAPKPV